MSSHRGEKDIGIKLDGAYGKHGGMIRGLPANLAGDDGGRGRDGVFDTSIGALFGSCKTPAVAHALP